MGQVNERRRNYNLKKELVLRKTNEKTSVKRKI